MDQPAESWPGAAAPRADTGAGRAEPVVPTPASGWHAEVLRTVANSGQQPAESAPPVVYGRASVRPPQPPTPPAPPAPPGPPSSPAPPTPPAPPMPPAPPTPAYAPPYAPAPPRVTAYAPPVPPSAAPHAPSVASAPPYTPPPLSPYAPPVPSAPPHYAPPVPSAPPAASAPPYPPPAPPPAPPAAPHRAWGAAHQVESRIGTATPSDDTAPAQVLDRLGGRVLHGDTPRNRLGRTLSRAVGGGSGEVHDLTDNLHRIQLPVTTCRRILVAGVRGGAGATTLAALLTSVYVRYRVDGALALETTRGHGSLAYRLAAAVRLTAEDASSLVSRPPGEAVAALSRHQHQPTLLSRPGTMDLDAYRDMSTRLMRFFGIAVIDGGHDAVITPGHLAEGHSVVLAIPATLDGMRTALSWFAEVAPDLRGRTVPVLVAGSPDATMSHARAVESLRAAGAPAVVLGYDRSLATGAPLQPARFARLTPPAVARIGAAALTLANQDRG